MRSSVTGRPVAGIANPLERRFPRLLALGEAGIANPLERTLGEAPGCGDSWTSQASLFEMPSGKSP